MLRAIIYLSLIWVAQVGAVDINNQLIAAVMQGKVEQARDLIVQGGDVNAKNPAGRPVIVLAAANGNTRTVQSLIASGADVNLANATGETALKKATRAGQENIQEMLKEAGAEEKAE